MAPEVVRGEKYSVKVDVYSFAILAYEVYYDTKKPFGEDTTFNVEYKVAQDANFRPKLSDECPCAKENNKLQAAAGIVQQGMNESGAAQVHEGQKVHNEMNVLIGSCWQDDPENRPSLFFSFEVLKTKIHSNSLFFF